MKIELAKTAGFCFGVRRAIDMVEELIEQNNNEKLYSLGHIIHNKQVVERFEKKGVIIVEDIEEVPDKNTVIIRAHGIPKEIYDRAQEKDLKVIDTTCPYVKKIHRKVSECNKEDRKVIIIGDKNHPEVIGIKGWNEDAVIIDSIEEAEQLQIDKEVCVVAQTTLSNEKWDKIIKVLSEKFPNCEIFNTICSATYERQKEARDIAQKADVMIVIGDPASSNSTKLYEISKKYCKDTYFIENLKQLPVNDIRTKAKGLRTDFTIGITAGASTPDRIIKEVVEEMSENSNTNEEMSFAELFEQSIKTVRQDEVIKGRVIGISNDEVFVDLGYKSDGIIPSEEFSDNPEEKPSNILKVGDEIEVYVVSVNDGEGNVLLSRKRLEYIKGWDRIEEAFEKGSFVKGYVNEVVNGGVISVISGVKVFVPASQLSDRYVEDLNEFRKKPVTLKIIDLNKQKKKVVGSQKAFLAQEKEKLQKDLWENIQVGQVITGTAKRITDFGVFVDIGGVDGLVHISELSWNRIKHPSEVVKEGQQLEVKVIDIDKEKGKISLGYKKTMDDPWQSVMGDKYEVGQIVKGKVVNIMPFGAFVEIETGLTGLVHISQMSDKRIKRPQEVLNIGDEVEAKITEIDKEKKKISLSIKDIASTMNGETAGSQEDAVPEQHSEEMNVTLGDIVNKE